MQLLARFPLGFLPGKQEACTQEDDDYIPRANTWNFWGWEIFPCMLHMWIMRRMTSWKQQSNFISDLILRPSPSSFGHFCVSGRPDRHIGYGHMKILYTPTIRAEVCFLFCFLGKDCNAGLGELMQNIDTQPSNLGICSLRRKYIRRHLKT